jgi:hypothetical protein
LHFQFLARKINMKRWAALVVLLYFLILAALTSPLIFVAFYPLKDPSAVLLPFFEWLYWTVLGVFLAAQAVMLLVPVELSLERPKAQRSVLWPILASGLMMGVLGVGVAVSINEFIRKDHADSTSVALPWGVLFGLWALWTVVFYRMNRGVPAMDVVTRQCSYLMKGSILELLVAVPTHIVARMRDYCCAGFWTFVGIAFGVAVMLFSFGPGVFFLFAARWKRLHPSERA